MSKVTFEAEERGSRSSEGCCCHWRSVNPISKKSMGESVQDMTVHGVQQVAQHQRVPWSRLLWAVVFCASLGTFLYMYYELQVDYLTYPSKTVLQSMPTDSMQFPAITICNLNTLDVSNLSYKHALRSVISSSAFGKRRLVFSEEEQVVLNMSAQSILEDTDPGLSKFMYVCFYDEIDRNCSELFDVTYWGMTRCYTLDVTNLAPAQGKTSLRVILDIRQDGYVVSNETSAGIKFFVHEKELVPVLDSRSSIASPGFSTHVGFRHQRMELLDYPFKSYGDRYCYKTQDLVASGVEESDQPYRLTTCLKDKALQRATAICSCASPFFDNSTFPTCTLQQMMFCMIPALDVTKENIYNASDLLGCPLPCDTDNYLPSVSFSFFPSRQTELVLLSQGKVRDANVRENVLEVVFFYEELTRSITRHVPEYTSSSLMGNVGGNMGFFLGASILSVGEMVELVLVLLFLLGRKIVGIPSQARNSSKAQVVAVAADM